MGIINLATSQSFSRVKTAMHGRKLVCRNLVSAAVAGSVMTAKTQQHQNPSQHQEKTCPGAVQKVMMWLATAYSVQTTWMDRSASSPAQHGQVLPCRIMLFIM